MVRLTSLSFANALPPPPPPVLLMPDNISGSYNQLRIYRYSFYELYTSKSFYFKCWYRYFPTQNLQRSPNQFHPSLKRCWLGLNNVSTLEQPPPLAMHMSKNLHSTCLLLLTSNIYTQKAFTFFKPESLLPLLINANVPLTQVSWLCLK